MCKCTPEKRTPYCGAPGCEWPDKEPEIGIQSLNVEQGKAEMKLTAPKEVLLVLAHHLSDILEEHKAPNFVTMTVYHPEKGALELTVSKVNGKSPAQKIAELEQKVKELEDYKFRYESCAK